MSGQADTDLYKQVQVEPFADFGSLDAVLVLVPRTGQPVSVGSASRRRLRRGDVAGLRRLGRRRPRRVRPTSCSWRSSRSRSPRLGRGRVAGFAGGPARRRRDARHARRPSLLLTLAGYWAGRYGETTGRGRAFAPLVAAFAIRSLVGVGGFALHFLLGEPVSARACARHARAARAPDRAPRAARRTGSAARSIGAAAAHTSAPARSSSLSSDAPYGERRTPSTRFLPPDPSVQAPYRLTPGLALRVGILGAVALAVFAVLFFRLWSLQVLSGERYLEAAQNNQLRTIRVEAPRGPILDRNGR